MFILIENKHDNCLHADFHKRHVFCKKPQKARPLWHPVKQALCVRNEKTITIMKIQMVTRLIFLIIVSVSTISSTYLWLLPNYFKGYSTYSILILGVLITGVLAGLIYSKSSASSRKTTKGILTFLCGLVAAIIVTTFSLLIIINETGI